MDWALDYYTKQSRTFAAPIITDSHRAIAERLHGWCREVDGCRTVLELGAGNGGTAAALADLGYDVCAIEFNPSDAAFARELASVARSGSLDVVESDFYDARLDRRFDFVFYWDGFGIGTDDDQRRLMRRIAQEWLAPHGRALLDVFSPWNWMKQDGETSQYTAKSGETWRRTIEFDALSSRFLDHWEPLSPQTGAERRTQSIRCYSIPELKMLTEGTGLAIDTLFGMDGHVLNPGAPDDAASRALVTTNGFFALMKCA